MRDETIQNVARGVDAALTALIKIAQHGMIAAAARGNDAQAFVGFLQAVNDQREDLAEQILLVAMTDHPENQP